MKTDNSNCYYSVSIHVIFMSIFTLQTDSEKKLQERLTKLMTILSGDTTIDLHLQFLIRNNKTDLLILKNTKVRNKPEAGTPTLY